VKVGDLVTCLFGLQYPHMGIIVQHNPTAPVERRWSVLVDNDIYSFHPQELSLVSEEK